MSIYIKLSTGEYPRHIGDIEIDPAGMADYAPIEWVEQPEMYDINRVILPEPAVQLNGKWHMAWSVRDATQEEIESIIEIRKYYEEMTTPKLQNPSDPAS